MLVEGMSVRGCERLTGVHRDTVLRILVMAGQKCERLMEREVTNVFPESVQIDECFTRVRTLQKNAEGSEEGDQYLMTALCRNTKFIIAHIVGKRNEDSALALAHLLKRRVNGRFQITSDGWLSFISAIKEVLFGRVDYAVQIKEYANVIPEQYRRYSPGHCVSVKTRVMFGNPLREVVSTSHVERSNLSVRHFNKRFTRLTLGYSKKLSNLRYASALYVAHFNFCRTHSALDGQTPAMAIGDCATLRWAEVDLARGIIRRIPNKTARRNPKPVLVPIHPVSRTMLAETLEANRREYVLPEIAALYHRRIDLVTDLVQNHFKACGIELHKPGTGNDGKHQKAGETGTVRKRAVVEVGFHSLRHTFVSLCRASNAPLSVVESIVGHSSPAMTQHYTHTGELAAGHAVAALPFVIGNDNTPPKGSPTDPATILREAQRLAKSLTAKNWKATRSELLGLLASCPCL